MKKYSFFAICLMAIIFAGCDQPSAFHPSGDESNNPSGVNGIGIFSIAKDKKVTFSRGNLQYTQTTNTWSFAENQYDVIGMDNVIGGNSYGNEKYGNALADRIDLFGWSADNTTAPFGVSTSINSQDYLCPFFDWGRNQIGNDAPNTWRTLSHDEWAYLFHGRANAENLFAFGSVKGVNGIIILPDDWKIPNGLNLVASTTQGLSWEHSEETSQYQNDNEDNFTHNTYTSDQWSKLEKAGAVFLPASGYRAASRIGGVQFVGDSWSASNYYSYNEYARRIVFSSDMLSFNSAFPRFYGLSVRLVKDL